MTGPVWSGEGRPHEYEERNVTHVAAKSANEEYMREIWEETEEFQKKVYICVRVCVCARACAVNRDKEVYMRKT